jgi:peptidoglycan hydrolase CwlO-like protein
MIKKIIFFLFIVFSVLFTKPVLVFADDQPVCNTEEECIKKLADLSTAKNTLANQLKLIDSQVQLTLLKITQTENSITTLKQDISNLTVQIGKLDVQLNDLSSMYVLQIIQNYKLEKRIPPFAFLISSNINNYLEQYKYVSNLQKASQNSLINMETVRTNYDNQKTEKAQKQAELEDLQKTLDSQQASLTSQKAVKNQLLQTTNDEYQKVQNQIIALRSFSSSAGGSSCLSSSPGSGNDGNYFSQRDPSWCKNPIGLSSDTIGEVGCYISSISMVFKKLGSNINPATYAANPSNFALNTAFAVNPNPPSGYSYQQVNYSASTVDKELKSGRYVIAQMRMSGSVSGMHFIVIIGGSDGNYKIHDPWFGPDLDFCNKYFCYKTSMIMSLRLFTK